MAFESVVGAKAVKPKDLKDGEFIEGYFKGIVQDNGKHGPQYNLQMVDDSGSEFKIYSGGTLTYFAKAAAQHLKLGTFDKVTEEEMKNAAKCVGHYVRITRTGSYTQKSSGKEIVSFSVDRDPDKKLF